MKIVPLSNSEGLASKVSEKLGIPLERITRRRFADGELYVKLEEPIEDAIIIGNTYPDSSIIELILTEDAINNAGGKRKILVVPYYGYARQDAMFQQYEAISARALASIYKSLFEKIFVVNIHSPEGLAFLGEKGKEIRSEAEIGKQIKLDGNDIVISPDDGFSQEAGIIAQVAGISSSALNKKRVSDTKVIIEFPEDLDVNGKRVALVDDLISTGGTILEASKLLKSKGATRVNVYCIHGLFISGTSKYSGYVDKIVTTDTVEGPFSSITVSGLIAQELKEYLKIDL
ncbi:MAG: ribose-phosphate diphosphokinase [Thermoplasmatales archaeon]